MKPHHIAIAFVIGLAATALSAAPTTQIPLPGTPPSPTPAAQPTPPQAASATNPSDIVATVSQPVQQAAENSYVTVVGHAVNKPQRVMLPSNQTLTLFKAVESAGNHTQIARRVVDIARIAPDGAYKTFQANLYDAEKDPKKDIELQNGDIVYVHDNCACWDVPQYCFVIGAVNEPGSVLIWDASPNSSPRELTLGDVLTSTGGLTSDADHIVTIVRGAGDSLRTIVVNLDDSIKDPKHNFLVQNTDIINVFAKTTTSDNQRYRHINVIGQVNKPGPVYFPLNQPITIVDAVAAADGHNRIATHVVTITRHTSDSKTITLNADLYKALGGDAKENIELQDGDTVYVDPSIGLW